MSSWAPQVVTNHIFTLDHQSYELTIYEFGEELGSICSSIICDLGPMLMTEHYTLLFMQAHKLTIKNLT